MQLQLASHVLDLSKPVVMGVLNVTPDSFSDGGTFLRPDAAIARGERMVEEGAAIIDIGGESTRPGAAPVSADEELRRILPVIERLVMRLPVPLSVDTSKPEVMQQAIAAGAAMINDVRALRRPGALAAVAAGDAAVCLMHMQGEPATMQREPHYVDVVDEVERFLAERIRACLDCGIGPERLVVDPGFGFGKTLDHNLQLLRSLSRFKTLGAALLVGLSRKSMIGKLLGRVTEERVTGSVVLAALAAWQGADIIRAHDVAPTVDALRLCAAVREGQ